MRAILIVLGALVLGGVTFYYASDTRQERLEFNDARQRWHQDCDAYVGTHGEDATRCQARLEAMLAYAKQRGW